MKLHKGPALYLKAKKYIPGGTQLLSKRPEMFLPDYWPAYYKKCKGIKVWDLDGNQYLDFSHMGVGACPLGYGDDNVDRAVIEAVHSGNMCTLNVPEEVELAQLLCKLHSWADNVRYCRSGGEAMAIAVRIARAKTKKDIVLICGYHGWHDWYLASNLSDDSALDGHLLPGLSPSGVPRGLSGTVYPFRYNNIDEFTSLANKNKGKIAAIVLETIRNDPPDKEFISSIREVSEKNNSVFIVDEITCGWRLNIGGAHLLYDIKPDMAVFAKAISNGYPMAAIIGKKEIMKSAQDSFISSTYWTDKIGPVAALATIKKMMKENIPAKLIRVGKQIQEGWKTAATKHGLKLHVSGIFPLSHFSFGDDKSLVLKTLYTQLMLEKGFLASSAFYATSSHTPEDIKKYLEATEGAFSIIAQAVKKGSPKKLLKGSPSHPGFKRLN